VLDRPLAADEVKKASHVLDVDGLDQHAVDA
jgi:hypothetical protein